MSEEILYLVDSSDNVIGEAPRDQCHNQGLWHRRATVFVFNSAGELLLQKRAPNMSRPNLWCGSASGHVLQGESYEQAARRELQEEIGIACDLKSLGKLVVQAQYTAEDIDKEHHELFVCEHNGPFNIQQEELSEVKFMSLDELQEKIKDNSQQFTPGFLLELQYYLQHR